MILTFKRHFQFPVLLIQEAASGSTNVDQQMLKDVEVEGDINLGNLGQKA